MMRLAVIGGSSVSTPGLVLALRHSIHTDIQVVLNGRSRAKLELVGRACQIAAQGSTVSVVWDTDLPSCLKGANFVLNQVRVGGMEARAFDEQFPASLGLLGEETLGAGGFCNALRTIPVALDLAEAVKQYAPDALIINLTNPSGMVQQAMQRFAGVKAVSICDSPLTPCRWVSNLLGVPLGSLEVDYVGVNHLGWVTAAIGPIGDHRDRLPEALAKVGQLTDMPFPIEWVQSLGVLPAPYLRYLYDTSRYLQKQTTGRSRATELMTFETETLQQYATLSSTARPDAIEAMLQRRKPAWYSDIIVPLITALHGQQAQRLIVQVASHGIIPGIGEYTTVEIPAMIHNFEVKPIKPRGLPDDCQLLLEVHALCERLAVEAIVTQDRSLALRALALNPLVGNVAMANRILEQVWP